LIGASRTQLQRAQKSAASLENLGWHPTNQVEQADYFAAIQTWERAITRQTGPAAHPRAADQTATQSAPFLGRGQRSGIELLVNALKDVDNAQDAAEV
jgi:hypothetical protein